MQALARMATSGGGSSSDDDKQFECLVCFEDVRLVSLDDRQGRRNGAKILCRCFGLSTLKLLSTQVKLFEMLTFICMYMCMALTRVLGVLCKYSQAGVTHCAIYTRTYSHADQCINICK